MTRVLLIHCRQIPHYRIGVYEYLSRYLAARGFDLTVVSDGIQGAQQGLLGFAHRPMRLTVPSIFRFARSEKIDVVIMFVDMRHLYLFPTYLLVKGLLGGRMIYWGQGGDLLDRGSRIKNLAYATEQALADAILLYAEHLKPYVPRRFHKKVFVANNTLAIDHPGHPSIPRAEVLKRWGITTPKNIICVGRIQPRKRLEHLIAAHASMMRPDVGLILAGPDPDGLLDGARGRGIFKVGEVYGAAKYDLLSAADVFCLPGAVGLSIVDAFHCGLPFVTEPGDESAEIAYLKDGVNGFVVPKGDLEALARTLLRLLDDKGLRQRFSQAARSEAATNANIERMGEGFEKALRFVTRHAG